MRGRYRRCARFFKNRCIEVSDHPPRFHAEAAGHELNLVRSLSPTSTLSKDLYRGESHQPPPHDTNGSKLIKVFLISRAASGKSSTTLQGIPGRCSPGVMSDMNTTIILQQPSAGAMDNTQGQQLCQLYSCLNFNIDRKHPLNKSALLKLNFPPSLHCFNTFTAL